MLWIAFVAFSHLIYANKFIFFLLFLSTFLWRRTFVFFSSFRVPRWCSVAADGNLLFSFLLIFNIYDQRASINSIACKMGSTVFIKMPASKHNLMELCNKNSNTNYSVYHLPYLNNTFQIEAFSSHTINSHTARNSCRSFDH